MRPLSFYARVTAAGAHLLLLAGLLLWSTTNLGLLFSALLILPLPGLLRGREYTYGWASLMLCIYCAGLLADGVAVAAHLKAAWALAVVAAVDFCAVVLFVRLSQRERSAQTAASAAASP